MFKLMDKKIITFLCKKVSFSEPMRKACHFGVFAEFGGRTLPKFKEHTSETQKRKGQVSCMLSKSKRKILNCCTDTVPRS